MRAGLHETRADFLVSGSARGVGECGLVVVHRPHASGRTIDSECDFAAVGHVGGDDAEGHLLADLRMGRLREEHRGAQALDVDRGPEGHGAAVAFGDGGELRATSGDVAGITEDGVVRLHPEPRPYARTVPVHAVSREGKLAVRFGDVGAAAGLPVGGSNDSLETARNVTSHSVEQVGGTGALHVGAHRHNVAVCGRRLADGAVDTEV